MSRRDPERLQDILDAIEAINSHVARGDLSDGLIFDAVRVRLIEIGEAASQTGGADFPTITFGHRKTAGYLMREEIPGGTTYPVGTVLLLDDDNGTHGPDQLQFVLGRVPYTPVFTVVGQVTSGLGELQGQGAGTVTVTGIR